MAENEQVVSKRTWPLVAIATTGLSLIVVIALATAYVILRSDLVATRNSLEQLKEAKRQLQVELQVAKNTISEMSSKLENSKAKLQNIANRLPDLPIELSFRAAVMGNGLVLKLDNLTPREFPVKVNATSPTFGKTRVFEILIPAKKIVEIGHMEGWAFTKGDTVSIHSEGFEDKVLKVAD